MRSYLAMELMGAIWFIGAVFAYSEKSHELWAFCCAVALSYFMRAMFKYYSGKETSNAPKTILDPRPGVNPVRLRYSRSHRGNDAVDTGDKFSGGL